MTASDADKSDNLVSQYTYQVISEKALVGISYRCDSLSQFLGAGGYLKVAFCVENFSLYYSDKNVAILSG